MINLFDKNPTDNDWQEIAAQALAGIRNTKVGDNEYYEAAIMGEALSNAGFVLSKR